MSYIALIENAISEYQLKYKKKPTHVLIHEHSFIEDFRKTYIPNASAPLAIKDVMFVRTLDIPPYYVHCFVIEDNL